MIRSVSRLWLGAGLVVSLSCGGASPPGDTVAGRLRAEVDTLGDTITVRTLAGSEWGAASLEEELRIGRVDGAEHEMFGQIGALAVTPDGDILIYDAQANQVRRFGPDGQFRGVLGGAGSGPGEYRHVAGMAVLADGRIVVYDFGNRRLNLYTAAGESLATWVVGTSGAEMRPLYPQPDGGVLLHDLWYRTDGARPDHLLVRLDAQGSRADTVVIPGMDYRRPGLELRTESRSTGQLIPFTASREWAVTTSGDLVTMTGDRYVMDVRRAGTGSVLRITRAVGAVPVSAEERLAEEARITAFFQRLAPDWRWDGPAIPATKPPLRSLHTGRDGSIWVQIAQPGHALAAADRLPTLRSHVSEPVVFDRFDADGRLLGQVRAPDRLVLLPQPVLDRDRAWGVVRDENGVEFVVRFRIVPD